MRRGAGKMLTAAGAALCNAPMSANPAVISPAIEPGKPTALHAAPPPVVEFRLKLCAPFAVKGSAESETSFVPAAILFLSPDAFDP